MTEQICQKCGARGRLVHPQAGPHQGQIMCEPCLTKEREADQRRGPRGGSAPDAKGWMP